MKRLSNIRMIGRYRNTDTGQTVNVHVGREVGRSSDVHFYLYRGKRNFIVDSEFYSKWKKEPTI